MVCQTGGGIIKRKIFLSVLLLFGLLLVLNVNTTAAATVTTNNNTVTTAAATTNSTIPTTTTTTNNKVTATSNTKNTVPTTTATTNSAVNATATTLPKAGPKITSTNPVGNGIVSKSQTIVITYNETIKAGSMWIVLTNNAGTVINSNDVISGNTLSVIPTSPLVSGVKYILAVHTNSIEDLYGDGTSVFSTSFTLSPITLAQMKDGITRAENFDTTNSRLPNYVSYGTTDIPIAEFEQIIATQGLKIAVPYTVKPDTSSVEALAKSLAVGSTSQAMTATRVYDWVRDNINYTFYYDSKYGAAGTLARMGGNCCDTANLLVALARDDGIQARYVHGDCDFSGNWYGHVWAQLYVNGQWVTADATSYSNSLGVVKNWDTATYVLEGIYTTLPF